LIIVNRRIAVGGYRLSEEKERLASGRHQGR
jgi:hypothetical protein